jgi:AbrB family looped-hinge helix DNA binding protein
MKTDPVRFTTKGQVAIPARLRKLFDIRDGTKAVVEVTPEGILLKPVTAALIKRGRGIAKRRPDDKPFDQWWAEHKAEEKALEEAKYPEGAGIRPRRIGLNLSQRSKQWGSTQAGCPRHDSRPCG